MVADTKATICPKLLSLFILKVPDLQVTMVTSKYLNPLFLLCFTFVCAKVDIKNSDLKSNTDSIITEAEYGNELIPVRIKVVLDEPHRKPCNMWCRLRKYVRDVSHIRNDFLIRKEIINDDYKSNKIPGLFLYNHLLRREKDIASRTNRLQQATELIAHRYTPLFELLQMLLPQFNLDINPENARLPPSLPVSPPQFLLDRIPEFSGRISPVLRRPILPLQTSTYNRIETQVTPLPLRSEFGVRPTATPTPIPTPIPAPPLPSPLFLSATQIPVPPQLILSMVPPRQEFRELSVASPVQSLFGISPTPTPSQSSPTTETLPDPTTTIPLENSSTPTPPSLSPSSVFRGESGIVIASASSTSASVVTTDTTTPETN